MHSMLLLACSPCQASGFQSKAPFWLKLLAYMACLAGHQFLSHKSSAGHDHLAHLRLLLCTAVTSGMPRVIHQVTP